MTGGKSDKGETVTDEGRSQLSCAVTLEIFLYIRKMERKDQRTGELFWNLLLFFSQLFFFQGAEISPFFQLLYAVTLEIFL